MNEATPTVPRTRKEIKLTAADEARFWAKVDKNGPTQPHMETPCWVWISSKGKTGYSQMWLKGKVVQAHRVAWVIANGPIPNDDSHHGICVCHQCDQRDCCRIDHLFLGTNQDNVRDMIAKGRRVILRGDLHPARKHPERLAREDKNGARTKPETRARGEANGFSKLTVEKVISIRDLHRQGLSYPEIGLIFNINRSTVAHIVKRKSWTHV